MSNEFHIESVEIPEGRKPHGLRACEHVGFFVIIGHGVDDAVVRAVFDNGRAFFARPPDQKMRIKRPGPAISRGYNGLAGQSLGLSMGNKSPPDLMESLGFGPFATNDDPYWTQGYGPVHGYPNLFPEDMPQLQRAVADYWWSMEELSGRINRIFALALGFDEDFFVTRSARHVTNTRINYYPAQDRPPRPASSVRERIPIMAHLRSCAARARRAACRSCVAAGTGSTSP
jgi:isopenicillin N synthase-like dioxygenase